VHVAIGQAAHLLQGLQLGERRGDVQLREAHMLRHIGKQLVDMLDADGGQHLRALSFGVGVVTHGKHL
jgi:hypothetical protein